MPQDVCPRCGAAWHDPYGPVGSIDPEWSQEVRFDVLTGLPEVRARIAERAAMAEKKPSGEAFLAWFDEVGPLPIPLEKLSAALRPGYEELGIRTGKERSGTVTAPPGATIVAALCSFARRGQALRKVRQYADGCLFEAVLPSDMWSWEGTLYVTVRESPDGSRVHAATHIGGQLFDWGKSKRALCRLFEDLEDETR